MDLDGALLDLAAAARPIAQGRAAPTTRQRLRLADAVVNILLIGRLGGLPGAPVPSRAIAFETFRAALRLATAAGVPRIELVALFNGDDWGDDPAEPPARKDLQ